jgi:hypothetical protein
LLFQLQGQLYPWAFFRSLSHKQKPSFITHAATRMVNKEQKAFGTLCEFLITPPIVSFPVKKEIYQFYWW